MFDIATLDTFTPANHGAEMQIINPITKQRAVDENKKPITITLLGSSSARADDARQEMSARRLDFVRSGIDVPRNLQDDMNADFLAAITVTWSFDTLDGQPFPFTPANAKKLWSDKRFSHVAQQALLFVADPANFPPG